MIGVVADPVGVEPGTPESFPGLLYLPLVLDAKAEVIVRFRAPAQPANAGQVMQRLRAENTRLVVTEIMTLDRYSSSARYSR